MEKQRVLVIDDDRDMATGYVAALRDSGYISECVDSHASALARCSPETWNAAPFDVLSVSSQLPRGGSEEVLRVATLLDPRPALLFLSSTADFETATLCIRFGAHLVPAPCDAGRLCEMVASCLTSARAVQTDFAGRYGRRHKLSPRQVDALRLEILGCTLSEAADRMGVGVSTVSELWKRIFQKTKVRSRREVVRDAVMGKPTVST